MRVAPKFEEMPLFFFCLIDKYSVNFLRQNFSKKQWGIFLENFITFFPLKPTFFYETLYLYFYNKHRYIIYKLAYVFVNYC